MNIPAYVPPNWADLPVDLLVLIAERLPAPDYFRFRAVCTSWASASRCSLHLAPRFPWLMLTRSSDHILSFFSFTDNKFFHIPGPFQIEQNYCIGPGDCWLVLTRSFRSAEIYVLNPLTGSQFQLPSFSSLPEVRSPYQKVILSAKHSAADSFIAVVSYGSFNQHLAIARPGDEKWFTISTNLSDTGEIADFVFHKGKIMAISRYGKFNIFDVARLSVEASMTVETKSCDSIIDDIYMVSTPPGDLLMVRGAARFRILKFQPEGELCWTELNDLGDSSLFLGRHHSMLLSAKEIPGIQRNCIYFARRRMTQLEETINDV